MSLTDVFAQRLSRPAARVLDGPIRDTIREMLREAGYASPAELQAVRDELRGLKGRTEAAEKRLAALNVAPPPAADLAPLQRRIEALEAELRVAREQLAAQLAGVANDAQGRIVAVEGAVAALSAVDGGADHAEVQALAARLSVLEGVVSVTDPAAAPSGARGGQASEAARAPLSAEPRGQCRVVACGQPIRAKGLCSSHYQQMRRGTLEAEQA